MNLRSLTRLAAVVVVLLAFGAIAAAPAQIDIKPPAEKPPADRAAARDPALQTHVDYLAKLIDHQNRIIRRSAQQGLTVIGEPALATLEGMAADKSTSRGKAAAKLVATIRKRMDRAATRSTSITATKGKKKRKKNRTPGIAEKAVARALQAAGADASKAGQVKPIVDDHRRRMRELKQQNKGADRQAAREQRDQAMHEYRNQLRGVLGDGKAGPFIRALMRQRGAKRKSKAPSDATGNPGDA